MYSKAFEKVFEAKVKPKIEEFPLENGVTKTVNNEFRMVEFSKKEVIDGLEYFFRLSKRGGQKSWTLGFGTEHRMLLTNKGLVVYKEIINNVVTLVNTARHNEKIDKISFVGADEDLKVGQFEEFKNLLKSKTEKDIHILDNFSYIKDEGSLKTSIHIRNGEVTLEQSGTRVLGIKDRIRKEDPAWGHSNTFSINEFINNQLMLQDILQDKEIFSALMRHIGVDLALGRNSDHRDAAKLRADLYERTLKQKFAGFKFERNGNNIMLSL